MRTKQQLIEILRGADMNRCVDVMKDVLLRFGVGDSFHRIRVICDFRSNHQIRGFYLTSEGVMVDLYWQGGNENDEDGNRPVSLNRLINSFRINMPLVIPSVADFVEGRSVIHHYDIVIEAAELREAFHKVARFLEMSTAEEHLEHIIMESICSKCRLAGNTASESLAREGWIGCRKMLEIYQSNLYTPSRYDGMSSQELASELLESITCQEAVTGWVDNGPFGHPTGRWFNGILMTKGTTKCSHFQADPD